MDACTEPLACPRLCSDGSLAWLRGNARISHFHGARLSQTVPAQVCVWNHLLPPRTSSFPRIRAASPRAGGALLCRRSHPAWSGRWRSPAGRRSNRVQRRSGCSAGQWRTLSRPAPGGNGAPRAAGQLPPHGITERPPADGDGSPAWLGSFPRVAAGHLHPLPALVFSAGADATSWRSLLIGSCTCQASRRGCTPPQRATRAVDYTAGGAQRAAQA